MEKNRLIAYNVLKRDIINNGFCTGCGACEATCPVDVLHVKDDQVNRDYDCSRNLDLCSICNEVCPHSQALLLRSLEVVSDASIRSDAIGYLKKIVIAQANDSKIREDSSDGAVVTALLSYGVNNEIFDCAVVSQANETDNIKPKASVALTSEDIVSVKGSRFFPSAVLKGYGSAVNEYAKKNIAVVGLPCQVLALRKINAWKHKIGNKAKIIIGLFCFGIFSTNDFLRYLEKQHHLSPTDITKMQLSHDLIIHTTQGTLEIPLSEAKKYTLLGCKTCTDYTSEVADISVGSAYPLKEWSVVIIRTEEG